MFATSGYINGNRIVADENIASYEGRRVIITILDPSHNSRTEQLTALEHAKQVARELSGLWATHTDDSVEETVRAMRRGRQFDT